MTVQGTSAATARQQGQPGRAGRGVRHRSVSVDGLEVFYREAGPAGAPALVLLHGFPSARAYLADVPAAELHLLDGGHFALDEHLDTIAELVAGFLTRHAR